MSLKAPSDRPATAALWPAARQLERRPLVSILVLTLDGAGPLEAMLASLHQVNTYSEIEIIVVDHGSKDGTLQMLSALSERMPIRVIERGANHSFSASNNKAARFARGELLLLLNNDVVFTSDIIGPMVAALQDPKVGAVGVKHMLGRPSAEPGRIDHIGVRFRWDEEMRFLRPYHAKPTPIDARLSSEPALFAAVSAAAMLCRKSDYEAQGGLPEAYFYGMEDLDFCTALRLRAGLGVLCLNQLELFHDKNATRTRQGAEALQRQREANRLTWRRRWGYAVRRDHIAALAADDGSLRGRRFTVGLGAPDDALAAALREVCAWEVRPLQAGGEDLDLALGGPLPPGAEPHALELDSFERDPLSLRDQVLQAARSLRVAIKSGADQAAARDLAAEIAGPDLRVRIDGPGAWMSPPSLADDVALGVPGAETYVSAPDQINIWASGPAAPGADWDVPAGEESVQAAIRRLHELRSAGPA